jgi:hypothetical protein
LHDNALPAKAAPPPVVRGGRAGSCAPINITCSASRPAPPCHPAIAEASSNLLDAILQFAYIHVFDKRPARRINGDRDDDPGENQTNERN